MTSSVQTLVGIVVGFLIGIVAAFLGVAGGELWIPTLVLLFAVDIKLAGSLSLVVSLPTNDRRMRPVQPRSQLRCPA